MVLGVYFAEDIRSDARAVEGINPFTAFEVGVDHNSGPCENIAACRVRYRRASRMPYFGGVTVINRSAHTSYTAFDPSSVMGNRSPSR
jgi:hypothetical protein